MRRWLMVSMVVLVALAVTGCKKASTGAASGGYDGGGGGYAPEPDTAVEVGETVPGDVAVVTGSALELPGVSARLVKTADLALEVKPNGFRDALQEATLVAGRYGGFVLSTSVEGEDARSGSITVRIPSEKFEVALADLHELGTVEHESVSTEDVGQEFVDLEARLRNFRAQEAVLLRLYARATTIAETIRVQNEVSSVQLKIEELEGRLRYLRDQTALGTIALALTEAGAVPAKVGPLTLAWRSAVRVTTAIVSGLIVGLGTLLPIAVFVALLGLLVWPAVRRLRAARVKRQPAA